MKPLAGAPVFVLSVGGSADRHVCPLLFVPCVRFRVFWRSQSLQLVTFVVHVCSIFGLLAEILVLVTGVQLLELLFVHGFLAALLPELDEGVECLPLFFLHRSFRHDIFTVDVSDVEVGREVSGMRRSLSLILWAQFVKYLAIGLDNFAKFLLDVSNDVFLVRSDAHGLKLCRCFDNFLSLGGLLFAYLTGRIICLAAAVGTCLKVSLLLTTLDCQG